MSESIWDILQRKEAIISFRHLLDLHRRVKWAMIAATGSTDLETAFKLLEQSKNVDIDKIRQDIELVENAQIRLQNRLHKERSRQIFESYYEAWSCLSAKFITEENSLAIASRLRTSPHIEEIILFGSLARKDSNPRDIDLMILDNGYYSLQRVMTYSVNDWATVKLFTELFDTDLNRFVSAMMTGWLDILTINGSALKSRATYARAVVQVQQDGSFFENISRDLLTFDQQTVQWKVNTEARQEFAEIHTKFSRSRRWPPDRQRLKFPPRQRIRGM